MDFLNSLALSQSMEHFHLLLFIFNMLSVLFLPYLGLILGSTLVSVFYDDRGRREKNGYALRLAGDMLTCAIPNKSIYAFLALLPAFALVFVYAQLLQSTGAVAAGVMFIAVLLLLSAGVALYVFRFTGSVVVSSISRGESPPGEAGDAGQENGSRVVGSSIDLTAAHRTSGRIALVSVVISGFLSAGALSIAMNPESWSHDATVLELLVSGSAWIKFAQLLGLALGMTGGTLLFFAFSWNGGTMRGSGPYAGFIKRFAVRSLTIALFVLPLLLLLEVLLLPSQALSGGLFLLAGGIVGCLFFALHFVYAFDRTDRAADVAYAFLLFLAAAGMMATKDQVTIHFATNQHAIDLARVYDLESEKLKASLGVAAPALTGEDIYNARCSACHLFETKKIGPPYTVVVPKYAGKKGNLVAFILSPAKVDPAYPPMPSPGLKPAEADSIAEYLLRKTGTKGS